MPRCLSVSRAAVSAGREPEYLATLRDLAKALGERGEHLWVFRSNADHHTFLEFSESPSAASHRTVIARSPREAQLEARLRALADYEPDAWALWDEVALTPSADTKEGPDAP